MEGNATATSDLDVKIFNLQTQLREVPARMQSVEKARAKAAGEGDTDQVQKLSRELNQLRDSIDAIEDGIEDLQSQKPKAAEIDSQKRLATLQKELAKRISKTEKLFEAALEQHDKFLQSMTAARKSEAVSQRLLAEAQYHAAVLGVPPVAVRLPRFPSDTISNSQSRLRGLLMDQVDPKAVEFKRMKSRLEVERNKEANLAAAPRNDFSQITI